MSAFLAQWLAHYYTVGVQGSVHPEAKTCFCLILPLDKLNVWSPSLLHARVKSCTLTKGQSNNRIKKGNKYSLCTKPSICVCILALGSFFPLVGE